MPIPVPFFFKLTSFASFIFKSTITITDLIYLRKFWIVFLAIYHKFFHWFFFSTFITGMIFMIISHGSVIMLQSSLIHRCWYVDSGSLLFSSDFFKLHSLHDFASLTSLFLFIWLNSDSSLRTLHMVYTLDMLFYTLRPRQGSNFMNRKNDSRPLIQHLITTYSSLIFCMCRMSLTAIKDKP